MVGKTKASGALTSDENILIGYTDGKRFCRYSPEARPHNTLKISEYISSIKNLLEKRYPKKSIKASGSYRLYKNVSGKKGILLEMSS